MTPRPLSVDSAGLHQSRPGSSSSAASGSSSGGSTRYSDRFIPSRAGSGDFRAAFSLLHRPAPSAALADAENAAVVGNGGVIDGGGGSSGSGVGGGGLSLNARQSYELLLKTELLDVGVGDERAKKVVLQSVACGDGAVGGKDGHGGGRAPGVADPDAPHKAIGNINGGALGHVSSAVASGGVPNLFRFRSEGYCGEEDGDADGNTPAVASGVGTGTGARGSWEGRRSGGNRGSIGSGNAKRMRASRRSVGGGGGAMMSTSPDGGLCVDGGVADGLDLRLNPVGAGRDAAVALAAMNASPRRASRKISRSPFKVLDAPNLSNDFYLNLVDWSCENVLAVGLDSCVYLWSGHTSTVTKLCELGRNNPVCSVSWSHNGKELAVGTSLGPVQIWDAASVTLIRIMTGHTGRVGCLAWSSSVLSSGSKDQFIFNRDLRSPSPYVASLTGHTQEVCGLKWSHDEGQLASGGNDNQLLVWSASGGSGNGSGSAVSLTGNVPSPMLRFAAHKAAVKAIAWSPHARGLLASGGGTADKTIRFWNTINNTALAAVDTGSQVCNLNWSKNVNEIVSTHGYSQNQIIVWRYPSLSKVVTLTGHAMRVLYLAVSPSGETVVTGCGDETLRFWNLFPSAASAQSSSSASMLSPDRMHIR